MQGLGDRAGGGEGECVGGGGGGDGKKLRHGWLER